MRWAKYISPTLDNDGNIYLVTGEQSESPNKIYVVKYDINSLNVVEKFYYETSYIFNYGEAYVIGDNNNYLFVSTFFTDNIPGESEFVSISDKSFVNNSPEKNIIGYRRDLKKAGDFYYVANLNNENGYFICVQKMKFIESGGSAIFHELGKKKAILTYQAMISCDLTDDNLYILCAYFSRDNDIYHATVSAFDSGLNHVFPHNYDEWEKWTDGSDNSVFIKIVYLKDNSNFIVVHRHEDSIMRLRYFRYEPNDKFENKLGQYSIQTDYLDIENTQTVGDYGANDIIVLDQNKIIKVFAFYTNHLIISIIHFYDDNDIHSISIKIYNMYPMNGFYEIQIPRLVKMNNSFIVCLSAKKDGKLNTGFFLMNFPNVINQTLETSNIAVTNLIKLENKLFSLKIKLRILEIPQDFIFISQLKSDEVKVSSDELYDEDDIFTLRQFRIREGAYKLKFQSIAKGIDTGYFYSKVYNGERVINEFVEYKGRIGELTINLGGCLDGYYPLYNDTNLCTNLKPVNFYLDEEDHIYKPCPSNCSECTKPLNETFMNCIDCKQNFFMTEDSRSCYQGEIDNYYLDIDELIYKRCHPNCLRCSAKPLNNTFMNCKSCQYAHFLTEDTNSCYNIVIDNYYLDIRTLRRCHRNCFLCYGAPIDRYHMNCRNCKNNLYMTEDTDSCYRRVIDNYYLDNITLKRCHSNCLDCYDIENNITFYNCLTCYED